MGGGGREEGRKEESALEKRRQGERGRDVERERA